MGKEIRKVTLERDEAQVQQDLERYRDKAIELGATRSRIVRVDELTVDERVTLKCRIPRCFGYGVCGHCPPHTLTPAELREVLKKYQWAIFFTKDVPPEVIVRDRATIKERTAAYMDLIDIVNQIESLAFYDGYYLSVGFSAGSCRHTFCAKDQTCRVMEGGRCRFPLKARPSMEAVGFDVYKLVAASGWDIYPIGSDALPEDMPKGTLAGIIIIT
ncbi:MAG: DUF2284 domain-containing protein [Pseudomonadota bacterium]